MDVAEEDLKTQEEGEQFYKKYDIDIIISDLEKAKSLIIHTSVTKAILPELQSCLTKRV